MKSFLKKCNERWRLSCRNKALFESKNHDWLQASLLLPQIAAKQSLDVPLVDTKRGRPSSAFEALSESQKRRRTALLRESTSAAELAYAAQMKLRKDGHNENTTGDALRVAAKLNESRHNAAVAPNKDIRKFTLEEAVVLSDEADLTKEQYIYLRRSLVQHGANVLPCYDYMAAEKQNCYPDSAFVSVSQSEASVKVQVKSSSFKKDRL